MDTAGIPPAATSTPPPLPPRAERRKRNLPPPTFVNTPSAPPPNLTSPIVQAAQDVEHARRLLEAPVIDENLEDTEKEIHKMVREKEVTQLLMRMTDWVEELSSLLQRSYKKESELEMALSLAQSNLQMAHANNELEESSRKLGTNGATLRDFGWRPWSKRDSRRSTDDEVIDSNIEDTLTPLPKPQSPRNSVQPSASSSNLSLSSPPVSTPPTPSRFFKFSSLTRNSTSSGSVVIINESTLDAYPSFLVASIGSLSEPAPPPKPTQREKELAQELEKERISRQKVISEKAALEGELETLSQALFEQANKMVSNSNRKLAEIEEELRIAMEEREALKSTLRVIASHSHSRPSDDVRTQVSVDVSGFSHRDADPSTPRASSRPSSTTSSLIFEHDLSPTTPHPNLANGVDGEEDEEDKEVNDQVSSSPTDYSDEKEKESNIKQEEEEESSLPTPSVAEPVKQELSVSAETTEPQSEDSNEYIEQPSVQVSDETPASTTLVENTSTASTLLPDAVLGSPVSQYTLDSIHQSI